MKYWPVKPPTQIADYQFLWADALQEGEEIVSAAVVASGVTLDDTDFDTDTVTVWLSGGEEGTVARITATIVTNSVPPRTLPETSVLPIGGSPVSLAQAKAYVTVEHDVHDDLIAALLASAIGTVETMIGRNLTPKVETQRVRGFPCAAPYAIKLFKGPVSEVLTIDYDDADGVAQEVADHRLVEGLRASVLPAVGESWPSTYDSPGSVRLTYLAGYAPGEAPRQINQAVLMLMAHWYANREAVVTGTIATEVPLGVERILRPFRPAGLA